MAHITDAHLSVLDGLRSTCDGDWLPRAERGVLIGREALSVTAEGNEAPDSVG